MLRACVWPNKSMTRRSLSCWQYFWFSFLSLVSSSGFFFFFGSEYIILLIFATTNHSLLSLLLFVMEMKNKRELKKWNIIILRFYSFHFGSFFIYFFRFFFLICAITKTYKKITNNNYRLSYHYVWVYCACYLMHRKIEVIFFFFQKIPSYKVFFSLRYIWFIILVSQVIQVVNSYRFVWNNYVFL